MSEVTVLSSHEEANPGALQRFWSKCYSPIDWPEHAEHENGNYINTCMFCAREFLGHKRQEGCKECGKAENGKLVVGYFEPEMKSFTIEIPLFMLWESARPFCLTSDDWQAALTAFQAELQREIAEDGSTRVYQMLAGCMEKLTEDGFLRDMSETEIAADEACPFYPK